MNKTVVVTGSQGFIGGYLCRELLAKNYTVIGIDNFSKYGRVSRAYDNHPKFSLIRWDLSKSWPYQAIEDSGLSPDYIIAGAAMIGGISYFHKKAYDLLATNERIAANTFDAALAYQKRNLNRIVVISSSMVFESADKTLELFKNITGVIPFEEAIWPSRENDVGDLPPPHSTYGFQKLSTEYFAKGAWEQYKLPYTIVRPFNCVGLGEEKALDEEEVMSGNVKLLMSHVLPDLAHKVISGQDPLRIFGDGSQIRCYTHGKDIARGIRLAMECKEAICEDFNISTSRPTTVLELAKMVWYAYYGESKPFRHICDEPFKYDVQKRIPDVSKAEKILNFRALTPLETSVTEIVNHLMEKSCLK